MSPKTNEPRELRRRRPPWAPLLRTEVRYFIDLLVLSAAFFGALLLRFEAVRADYLIQLPLVVLVQMLALRICGIYSFLWRFIGLAELRAFVVCAAVSTSTLLALRFFMPDSLRDFRVPITVILFDAFLAYGGLLGIRVLRRVIYEKFEQHLDRGDSMHRPRKRVLLVGAGRAGVMAVRELQGQPQGAGLEMIGFLDDDPRKQGTKIQGLRVLGTTDELASLVEEHDIHEVLLTMVRVGGETITRIHDQCLELKVEVRIMPGLWEILEGRRHVTRFREVKIEDVLGRDEIELDESGLESLLAGKRVMVTGAGGSIGSELAHQVLLNDPERLLLVDRAEPSLFQAHCDLVAKWKNRERRPVEVEEDDPPPLVPLVADVGDEARMRSILWQERPQVILHAAAHKHVPLMEHCPGEAVKNNALATHRLGRLAGELGVERFVLVSTDKAVRPTSVMGASKRLAELFVLDLDRRFDTRYLAVRFGNVLGSTGSVVPLFQKQIDEGGPVTVTHRDMVRYFMTIPEASRLVLNAASMGQGGELLVLDMGSPVKILDLARAMIRLAGLEPEVDIPISFIGIRPGEKLYEELELGDESLEATHHPKIFVGRLQAPDAGALAEARRELEDCCNDDRPERLRPLLGRLVPEATFSEDAPATP